MTETLTYISKELNIPSRELINLSILAYLEHELRLAEEEIGDIRDKYLIANRKDLEKKIKTKEIYSHPAWEDLIIWENLETYIGKLKKTIERVHSR